MYFLCHLIWPRWFNFLFASVFHMLFIYSRKKTMTKKWKKILLTYLSYFLEHVTPSAVPRHIFILLNQYWISKKYVEQIILINYNWISPTLQKGWKLEFCLFFKKWGRVQFSPRKGEVGKMQRNKSCWARITYVYLPIFVFINQGNITIPGIYIKWTSFIIYTNFWDNI